MVKDWIKLITNKIKLAVLTKVAPTKGNIVYEYNPFYNYRINLNMYEYKGGLYSLADLWTNFKITLRCKIELVDSNNNLLENQNNFDNSTIKYYKISQSNNEEDYKHSAEIIVAAFKKGRNSDRLNLELALKNTDNVFNKTTDDSSLANSWICLDENSKKDFDENTNPILREAGELTDFITDELSFDLEHPVLILPLYSYDGSVNLVLTDGKNNPKLINSRFSATGKNTYEVCDRKGNNDTNIYDLGELFEIDTSLYKQTSLIPVVKLKDVSYGGNLKIGNYHFYFKLSDADGNESDFIAESGCVSIFKGMNNYSSVSTGERNDNSHKQINFHISNLDASYDYIHVYYSRYTAEENDNKIVEYIKIDKDFTINNARVANIFITGNDPETKIAAEDINLQFNVVDSAYTAAICLNRLFMANVHKPDVPYTELLDLSLRILPYLKSETYNCQINKNYSFQTSNKGYIDPKFIYEKTGYWTGELYRFGIVYIMPDNTLSPVFNIRGGCYIEEEFENDNQFTNFPIYELDKDGNPTDHRIYISSNEENYLIIQDGTFDKGKCYFENSKGVTLFKSNKDTDTIFSVNFKIPYEVKLELSKYIKGYFFVRQPRIPFVIAQGITVGIDKESHTPTIPTKGGIVNNIYELDLDKTHVCVEGKDENEIVFLSEGFLSRYLFKLVPKSGSIWAKIGKIVGIVVAVAAAVVVSIVTMGGGFAALAGIAVAVAGSAATAGASTIALAAITAAVIIGGSAVVTAAAGALAGTVEEAVYWGQRWKHSETYNRWETKVDSGMKIKELDNSRQLVQDFEDRIILTAPDLNYIAGIICPDFEINLPLYNQLFCGNEHLIKSARSQGIGFINNYYGDNFFENEERHFYIPAYSDMNLGHSLTTKINTVTDNLKLACVDDMKFSARAGEAEEAFRISYVGDSYKSNDSKNTDVIDEETMNNLKINSDIIRGSFGPFLGFYDKNNIFCSAETVNIYTAGYDESQMEQYVYQRAVDASVFYTISDRFTLNFDDNTSILVGEKLDVPTYHNIYRGDCYICLFTHRMNRNFTDPATLYNDEIVDKNTWKDNYSPGNLDKLEDVNRSDVNAILLGTWVTFKVRSSNNLNIRTEDYSNVEEGAMTGHPRSYFPKTSMSVNGTYKIPESAVYNQGFSKTLSERYNFEMLDVPWIKNWYGTRIMYSNLNVSDSFQNGFRVFKGLNYRDYTREYGEITKLISFESSLLVVFEHGVALVPVNERTVAGDGPGGTAYINTNNILPDNPRIISDTYGSQWADSILKVPNKFGDNNAQTVYGVDTVAKKIWRTDGQSLQCISDMKVQEFLNNNITLSEFELTPKLGIRNVKTFYNAFKRDVMFTFYDNTYGFEEKVWNLCWNELLNQFTTFYSWVPAVMENINNIPFSFNRNTSKWIAKLGTSHSENSFADGITLSNVILTNTPNNGGYSDNYKVPYEFELNSGETVRVNLEVKNKENFIGFLSLSNRTIPYMEVFPHVDYSLEHDMWGNREMFKIKNIVLTGDPDYGIVITEELLKKIEKDKELENDFDKIYKHLYGLTSNDIGKFILPTDAKFPSEIITLQGLYLNENFTAYNLMSELYYRNSAKHVYSDYEENKLKISPNDENYFEFCVNNELPIFKNKKGLRETLDEPYNKSNIVTLLNIKASISFNTDVNEVSLSEAAYNMQAGYTAGTTLIDAGYYESTVAVIPQWNMLFLSTDFWKHGQAGIFDIADKIKPTYWYGEQHPFEFEFIVANEPGKHKIFDNLLIISNNAEPESFHYEIIGDSYEFAKDKKNMYIRQEATKELYQNNGYDIVFDHDYTELEEEHRPSGIEGIYDKSTILPIYYGRQDTINEIYDSYNRKKLGENTNFSNLAGAELVLYRNLDEIRIWNHTQAIDITNPKHGRRYGNMLYKEDIWNIQINSINFVLRNENDWGNSDETTLLQGTSNKIPVELNESPIPEKVLNWVNEKQNGNLAIPNSFNEIGHERGIVKWTNDIFGQDINLNKEVKIKDKWLRVRIRYSGEKLAIINAINTLYSISFA